MNFQMRSYTCGSFFFTHASLEAVKLPGEFKSLDIHFSYPIPSSAEAPFSTALESHQIMELRTGLQFLSMATSPCIW